MPDQDRTQLIPTAPAGYRLVPIDDHEPEPESEPEPRRSSGAGWLAKLLVFVVILVSGVIAAALLLTPPRGSVLILGSDARPDEVRRGQVGRTDTLMVLVGDRSTPRLATLSVPRDLWVPIPGHGEERINAAYQLGGSQTAKQTVSNVIGQPIDRFVLIGLQGVRDVVDALGGIDITVDQPIYDAAYPTEDYGTTVVDIPAGRQHMDGDTALAYARTRHQDNDFGRIQRQQRVLAAVRSALVQPANWPRLPAVIATLQPSVQTDLGPLDIIALGAAALRYGGDPDRLVIDTALVEPFVGDGGAALLAPRPELRRAVARFLGANAATVEVLNGAGVPGLARTTADRLSGRGYEVTSVGDADRPQARTMILANPAMRAAALDVARVLNVATDRVTEAGAPTGGAEIRVILGADAPRS